MTDKQLMKILGRECVILDCASYMIDYGYTVRKIAKEMNVGKSTVHNWLTKDLKYINNDKYHECLVILARHKKASATNGGKALAEKKRRNWSR